MTEPLFCYDCKGTKSAPLFNSDIHRASSAYDEAVDSLSDGAGDALWTERDSTRVNIKSVPPRLPRDLDDMSLNLPRLQPLQRFFDRAKPSGERGFARHPGSPLGHLFFFVDDRNERFLCDLYGRLGRGSGRGGRERTGEGE